MPSPRLSFAPLVLLTGLLGGAATAQQEAPRRPSDASEADTRAVLAATETYLASRERGALLDAHANFTPELQAALPLDRYAEAFASRREVRGRLTQFAPLRIRQGEGEVVILDYVADFSGGISECGAYVWDTTGFAPQIARIDAEALLTSLVGTPDGDALMEEFGCAPVPEPPAE